MMKLDFWSALVQVGVALSSDDRDRTHVERIRAVAAEFARATPDRQREMRLALWAVLTFLEELSRSIGNHK